jgi:group I intron endonuclease
MLPKNEVYIVYKTINKVNSKFYIGVHKCKSIEKFDGYFGSGTLVKRAVAKYGKHNFERKILHICKNYEEAYCKEKELVTVNLIESDNCYNTKLGGDGGTTQNEEVRKHFSRNRKGKFTKEENHFYGRTHSSETRKKMSDAKKGKYLSEQNPNWKGGAAPKKFQTENERQSAQSIFMKNNNPMDNLEIKKRHAESMKNKPKVICPHCQKTMDMGGFAVHTAALKRNGIDIII